MDVEFSFQDVQVDGPTPGSFPDPTRLSFRGHDHGSGCLSVVISEAALKAMVTQAVEERQIETGGMLVGGYHIDRSAADRKREILFVSIHRILPARHTRASPHSLQFTHETWHDLTSRLSGADETERILGWYHSHPRSKAFMSEADLFIHRSFFSLPWHVAMVVSLVDDQVACFRWEEAGALSRCAYGILSPLPVKARRGDDIRRNRSRVPRRGE